MYVYNNMLQHTMCIQKTASGLDRTKQTTHYNVVCVCDATAAEVKLNSRPPTFRFQNADRPQSRARTICAKSLVL